MMKKRLLALLLTVVMLGSLFTQALATETDPTEAPTVPETTAAATEPEVTEEPTVPETTAPATEPTVPETTAPATEPEVTEEPTVPETTETPTESEVTEADDEHVEYEDVYYELRDQIDTENFVIPTDFTNTAALMPAISVPTVSRFNIRALFSSIASNEDGDSEEGDSSDGDGDGSEEGTEVPTLKNNANIETSKTVIYNNDGTYTLRLESYLTGAPTITTDERIPSDIVMVLDQSGSMDYCFICGDDDMDCKIHAWSGIKIGTQYYCLGADGSTKTKLHYCDGQTTACKYVNLIRTRADNPDVNYTHSRGWYSVDHSTVAQFGYRFLPSLGNSAQIVGDGNSYTRIFYSDSNCTNKVVKNIVEDGIYYRKESGNYIRQYYCDTCCVWYDGADHQYHYYGSQKNWKQCAACSGYFYTTKTLSKCSDHSGLTVAPFSPYPRIPDGESGDNSVRAFEFWQDYLLNHKVNSSKVDKSKNYYIRLYDYTSGDIYEIVSYCSTCSGWHIGTHASGKTVYQPTTRQFYTVCKEVTVNRKEALQDALKLFLADIYKDSAGKNGTLGDSDDVQNRIAMVGFGSYDEPIGKYNATNAVLTYSSNGTNSEIIGYKEANSNGKYYEEALQNVYTENGQAVVNDAVDNLLMVSNTETYKGMDMAEKIFAANPITEGERNRIVVVFTDGIPYSPDKDSTGRSGNYAFADNALTISRRLKNDGATVYTIGVFSGANASNMIETCGVIDRGANKFMHLLSTNYLNATQLYKKYDASDVNPDLTAGNSYYLSASTTEALNNIFKSIAQNITGGGAYITTLDEKTVVKDVVSEDFVVDTTRSITVHTETFKGKENGVMNWTDDNNDSTITANGKTVQYSGFNFAANYVATDVDNGVEKPRGKKLVIEIPIDQSSVNKGGYQQATNDQPESGIYLDGECFENFDLPHVDIPTDVTVTKTVVGANVPDDHKFNFDIVYDQFTDYEGNDQTSGNYLDANSTKPETKPALGDGNSQSLTNVLVDSTITITESGITDYLVEYRIGSGEWKTATKSGDTATISETVTAGMAIEVRNTLQKADLVITKTVDSANPDQSFLFNVTNDKGLNIPVVIPASVFDSGTTASVTVKDLEVGSYTVTEDTSWSWRYTLDSVTAASGAGSAATDGWNVVLTPSGETVTFDNNRTNVYWMDGESHAQNIFN